MRLGSTLSVTLRGLSGTLVKVEAHIAPGLPAFTLSGLPDAACAQSPSRIKAALTVAGQQVPSDRITVNLSPSAIPKRGSGFDLPIACAVLAAAGVLPRDVVEGVAHIGELGLDGTIRAVPGVLPAVAEAARSGVRRVIVPADNAREATLVEGVAVHTFATLAQLIEAYHTLPVERFPDARAVGPAEVITRPHGDLADVVGQDTAKLALEIAAAGGHHLMLTGPPGAGKTMLAERLITILPPLSTADALGVMSVRSLLGELEGQVALDVTPPFVAPHHSASATAIVGGGGSQIRPGAITRADHGVLFLDEAPEFKKDVLENLRQPLESGKVIIARARETVTFPARFQLVLAANPCPCGMAFGKGLQCRCRPLEVRRYASRISGPFADRIDLRVNVAPVTLASLQDAPGESSAVVRARVEQAREAQRERWQPWNCAQNAWVPGRVLRRGRAALPAERLTDLHRALDRGLLSVRGLDRCLRLAWTVADLRGGESPTRDDIGVALGLRGSGGLAA
ncbi:MAG: YifB family Mg chelatase-like AAA ATPase [Actinomycetia bacterium]|nr:YifB family Mg chelatase-like AAA ATPase [Actinomycetes bacterium]